MKRISVICILLAIVLIGTFLWMSSPKALENTLDDYEKAVRDRAPDGLKLTIYYMDPTIMTRVPIQTLEDLKGFSQTKTIVVGAAQLAAHADLIKQLDAAYLQPVEAPTWEITSYLRLVYVFEQENGEPLLEVMATNLVHDETILVNGFYVENKPIFYELIDPFLTDEDRSVLARSFDD